MDCLSIEFATIIRMARQRMQYEILAVNLVHNLVALVEPVEAMSTVLG